MEGEMRWGGVDRPPVSYLLRTVGIGVRATVVVLLCLVLFPFLPGHQPLAVIPYAALVASGAAVAVLVAVLPWRRLFERGLGGGASYAWSVLDIGLITGGVAATG